MIGWLIPKENWFSLPQSQLLPVLLQLGVQPCVPFTPKLWCWQVCSYAGNHIVVHGSNSSVTHRRDQFQQSSLLLQSLYNPLPCCPVSLGSWKCSSYPTYNLYNPLLCCPTSFGSWRCSSCPIWRQAFHSLLFSALWSVGFSVLFCFLNYVRIMLLTFFFSRLNIFPFMKYSVCKLFLLTLLEEAATQSAEVCKSLFCGQTSEWVLAL